MLTYDLEKRGEQTLYGYLYERIRSDILSGRIQTDEKLPSKRTLAKNMEISVKTVENAYEQLLVEGYVRAEEKRGYFANARRIRGPEICGQSDRRRHGDTRGASAWKRGMVCRFYFQL